jgi:hypothetical protein
MAKAKHTLTQERLKELLHYDPETGVFTNRATRNQLAKAGTEAGFVTSPQGYRSIGIKGRQYRSHRLAWLYVYGAWPEGDIDHINGVCDDNRIANLRDVSTSENCQNQRTVRSNSKSGLIGARQFRPGKWQSQIKVNGRCIHLGTFYSPEEAHAAYIAAKRKYHPMNTL